MAKVLGGAKNFMQGCNAPK